MEKTRTHERTCGNQREITKSYLSSTSLEVILDERLSGEENMKKDCAFFDRTQKEGKKYLRIYEWQGAWISLGRFQNPLSDLLRHDLVPWVIRPTGGNAVLHGHDITIALSVPLSVFGLNARNIKSAYRKLIAPIVSAFRKHAIQAILAEESRFLSNKTKSADCFRHIAPLDVVDENTGRKLVGCAMKITRDSVLAQCSIPIDLPLVDPQLLYANSHVAMPLNIDKKTFRESLIECYLLSLE